MSQDHHKSSNGRYYKDDSRRNKRYYPFNNGAANGSNYPSYSSYSSNPNPFPQQQQQQQQAQNAGSNPFSSRRNDSMNSNKSSPSSTSNLSTSPQPYSRSSLNRNSSNDWYNSSRRSSNFRANNRPSLNSTNPQNSSRRSLSNPYKNEDTNSSRYSDYNPTYADSYYTEPPSQLTQQLSSSGPHQQNSYKSKYTSNATFPPFAKHTNEYNSSDTQLQKKNGYTLIDSRPKSSNTYYNSKHSFSSKLYSASNADHSTDIQDTDKEMNAIAGATGSEKQTDNSDLDNMSRDNKKTKIVTEEEKKSPVAFEKETLDSYNVVSQATVEPSSTRSSDVDEDSSYIPPENTSVKQEVTAEIIEAGMDSTDRMEIDSNPQKELEEKLEPVPKESHVAVDDGRAEETILDEESWSDNDLPEIEGCIFPMREVEYRVWNLKNDPKHKRRKNLKYWNKAGLTDFSQYSFVEQDKLIFKQADAFVLFKIFKDLYFNLDNKKTKLIDQYVYQNSLWKRDCKFYDAQLKKIYENAEEESLKKIQQPQKEQPDKNQQLYSKPTSSRRSRHHGDSVRTEAEFMEILASLEQERERDPLVRAQYGAAIIPDMIIDPIEKYSMMRKMDSNNLVTDKSKWVKRLTTDPVVDFNEFEHERFAELYVLHPKKFGKISSEMGGLRTPGDCVRHYYRTKNVAKYKDMVKAYKKPKKKGAKRKKETKTRNDTATPDPSAIEFESSALNSNSESLVDINKELKTEGLIVTKKRHTSEEASSDNTPPAKQRKITEKQVHDFAANSTREAPFSKDVKDGILTATVDKEEPTVPQNNDESFPLQEHHVPPSHEVQHEIKPENITAEYEDSKKRKHITSYWSVQDSNMFPSLLKSHGGNWEEISKEIGTKSAAMVRNYYQRGLIGHPEWQDLASLPKEPNNGSTLSVLDHLNQPTTSHPVDSSLSGPAMGYFFKPPTAYAAATSTNPVLPTPQLNQQPVQQVTSASDSITVKDLPENQHAKYMPDSIATASATSSGNMPVPPSQPRNNIMNMNSLLNTPTSYPRPDQGLVSKPDSLAQSTHFPNKAPSIMNLLNNDIAKNVATIPASTLAPANSFQPNIRNIMNSTNTSSSNTFTSTLHYQHQPIPFGSNIPPVQQPLNARPPSQSLTQLQPLPQTNNLPQFQQQPPNQPLNNVNAKRAPFIGGTSALDALARIAFERK